MLNVTGLKSKMTTLSNIFLLRTYDIAFECIHIESNALQMEGKTFCIWQSCLCLDLSSKNIPRRKNPLKCSLCQQMREGFWLVHAPPASTCCHSAGTTPVSRLPPFPYLSLSRECSEWNLGRKAVHDPCRNEEQLTLGRYSNGGGAEEWVRGNIWRPDAPQFVIAVALT